MNLQKSYVEIPNRTPSKDLLRFIIFSATSKSARAATEVGSASTTGAPSSPPVRNAGLNGILPSNGTSIIRMEYIANRLDDDFCDLLIAVIFYLN
jgi:hypothetical protein